MRSQQTGGWEDEGRMGKKKKRLSVCFHFPASLARGVPRSVFVSVVLFSCTAPDRVNTFVLFM